MEIEMKEPQIFQWVKGEYEGKLVKVVDSFVDDNLEFLVFEDGSQCNSALIGEYIMPVAPGATPPLPVVSAFAPPVPPKPPVSKESAVPQKSAKVETAASGHPVHELLKVSKKKQTKLQLVLEVEMPSEDLIRVVNESYENGGSIIGDYLVSTIDKDALMKQIEELLKAKIEQINSKKKSSRNESNS
jgi:hypothetical protein